MNKDVNKAGEEDVSERDGEREGEKEERLNEIDRWNGVRGIWVLCKKCLSVL